MEDKNKIEEYVKGNIKDINSGITQFVKKEKKKKEKDEGYVYYDETDIKKYLKEKFDKEFKGKEKEINDKFEKGDYKKEKVPEIANEYVFYHKDLADVLIGAYVEHNIKMINKGIKTFADSEKRENNNYFDQTDIRNYLKEKFDKEYPEKKKVLIEEFESKDFEKGKIRDDIANSHVFYYKDLENAFITEMISSMTNTDGINKHDDIVKSVVETIFKKAGLVDEWQKEDEKKLKNAMKKAKESRSLTEDEEKLIKRDKIRQKNKKKKLFLNSSVEKITKKSLYLLFQNGFSNNINNVESGVMTANAGDSAQFLFVSRAILAGFNCSNVDVRSSRYDAVIDYRGKIFKVQIKGITDDKISFYDRARGGRGIDYHADRNSPKLITSKDCDIYVAVDKQVGICYLIPMDEADNFDESKKKSLNVNDEQISKYRENWDVVAQLFDRQNSN